MTNIFWENLFESIIMVSGKNYNNFVKKFFKGRDLTIEEFNELLVNLDLKLPQQIRKIVIATLDYANIGMILSNRLKFVLNKHFDDETNRIIKGIAYDLDRNKSNLYYLLKEHSAKKEENLINIQKIILALAAKGKICFLIKKKFLF